jgi:tRNA(Ile2) C34 agmatinyltransferase TiaS
MTLTSFELVCPMCQSSTKAMPRAQYYRCPKCGRCQCAHKRQCTEERCAFERPPRK